MDAQLLHVTGERDANRVRIRAAGAIDAATAPQLATCFTEQMAPDVEMVELDKRAAA